MEEKKERYYENTVNKPASVNVNRFLKLVTETGNAVELGCGSGRDTVCLIKNNWNVLAIDIENTKKMITEKLNEQELKRFRFLQKSFEETELEKCNLLLANNSLPFCKKENFKELWNKIENSIEKNGYFLGSFFGDKDEWNGLREDMTFLTKQQVIRLFKNFEIINFSEFEGIDITGIGRKKYWHTFNVMARKK